MDDDRNDHPWSPHLACEALAEAGRLPLLLVRHGRTAWNLERRFLGRSDVPLDEVGLEQARLLARRLREVNLAAIYTSPLQRAARTAEQAREGRNGVELTLVADLAELAQGELEGQPDRVLPERYPDFFRHWRTDPATTRVPGGETLSECRDRAVAALTEICLARRDRRPILVLTHQMVTSCLVCTMLGLDLRHYHLVRQGNTALNLLSWAAPGFQVHRLNDSGHLPA